MNISTLLKKEKSDIKYYLYICFDGGDDEPNQWTDWELLKFWEPINFKNNNEYIDYCRKIIKEYQ